MIVRISSLLRPPISARRAFRCSQLRSWTCESINPSTSVELWCILSSIGRQVLAHLF
ncbi:hypothetical protein PISMIDRAFT_673329, partial [Pisolithus microcarpus 441]